MAIPNPQRPLSDKGDTDERGSLVDRKTWVSGILVQFHYSQTQRRAHWGIRDPIHDRQPVCVVLYSDRSYTHAINVSYLSGQQRRQFKSQMRFWYFIDPRLKYYYLKTHNRSVLHAYRTYFTALLTPFNAWDIDVLEGTIPEAYDLLGKIRGVPTDWSKFKTRVQASARARDVSVRPRTHRPRNYQPLDRPTTRPMSIRVSEAVRRIDSAIARGTVTPPPLRPSQRP